MMMTEERNCLLPHSHYYSDFFFLFFFFGACRRLSCNKHKKNCSSSSFFSRIFYYHSIKMQKVNEYTQQENNINNQAVFVHLYQTNNNERTRYNNQGKKSPVNTVVVAFLYFFNPILYINSQRDLVVSRQDRNPIDKIIYRIAKKRLFNVLK